MLVFVYYLLFICVGMDMDRKNIKIIIINLSVMEKN